jgi:hypothetical protein
MLIEKKDNYSLLIPEENSFEEFFQNFHNTLNSLKGEHLLIRFSDKINISIKEILLFLDIANDKRESGTSFVVIVNGIDIDEIPDEINVVPTLTEAIDILEMDAMERDLMDF